MIQTLKLLCRVTLVTCVVICAASRLAWAQSSNDEAVVKNASEQKMTNLPNIPKCGTSAVLSGDPSKGPSTLLIKLTGSCTVPWHWHTPNEQLMMASGVGRFQMKDAKPVLLRPGGYAFAPSHHVHQFSCASTCLAFLHSEGPFDLHYVDGSGKEISMDEALKKPKAPAAHAKKK
ncbi:MAG: cupin domain-containing protein [Terriglobia bacterium]